MKFTKQKKKQQKKNTKKYNLPAEVVESGALKSVVTCVNDKANRVHIKDRIYII